ncbi:NAD(P)H-binding protein [Caulobacter mirabilis]|uniref:NAD(P)-binding domain-containing protein n=1 Tax=Caulobacter mirabilis TaxID=69666 RepID=A0A2D2B2N1_9CAUL|nr:NAD(P)H-binding protein [Caulobacter mirabilis]ATQ44494.1 hypothetical protein CSW64_19935 [Caulobacter mirabilis]
MSTQTNNTGNKTALVLGATGGVGGEMTRALIRHGWRVRALARRPEAAPAMTGVEWVKGDAMDRASVVAAAQGASTIVHAVNPPGYRNWAGLVLPMIDNTIDAAAAAGGARIVLPGTIYNYGPDALPLLKETSPQTPVTRKGRIRVELERRLEAAAEIGVPSLVLRCGDFFGPRPGNNWFSQGLVSAGKPVAAVTYPGPLEIGHAWAYLPDVGETAARLLAFGDDLAPFATFHMEGHWLEHGGQMVEAIARAVGRPDLPVKTLPWTALRLAAPFNETLREMLEMRYLWQAPIRLDNRRLVALLGAEPRTPLNVAVKASLQGAGCLPPIQNQPASRRAFA